MSLQPRSYALRSGAARVPIASTPRMQRTIEPLMDPLVIAASGMRSAELRLAASAHNVANLGTPSFRPLRVTQTSIHEGGSVAHQRQEPHAREVDLAHEILEQIRASSQFEASLRVYAVASGTQGYLIDLFA